jgi:hypothetical protein
VVLAAVILAILLALLAVLAIPASADKLYKFLDLHTHEIYRRTGQVPKRVIIGWRTFKKFAQSHELNDMLANQQVFDMPSYPSGPPSPYERAFYRGYKIFTFPWFEEGVIMLPNDL